VETEQGGIQKDFSDISEPDPKKEEGEEETEQKYGKYFLHMPEF